MYKLMDENTLIMELTEDEYCYILGNIRHRRAMDVKAKMIEFAKTYGTAALEVLVKEITM